jgi:putative transcriptional regulator
MYIINVKVTCQRGDKIVKNRVEELRKSRKLSQEEFAKAIRVSRQTVSSIETGKYNPSLELAFTISDFFGLPIEEIFMKEVNYE